MGSGYVLNTSAPRGYHASAYYLVQVPQTAPAIQQGPLYGLSSLPAQQQMGGNRSSAPTVYGIQNYGMQRYLPIAERRALTPQEHVEVRKGLSQWWPKLGAGYFTSIPQMLASPIKNSLLVGGLGGSVTGLFALAERTSIQRFGAIGALIGASLCGIGNYIRRKRQNENIMDLMQRLPEGATKRDLLSDPAYQEDLRRASITGEGAGKDLGMAINIMQIIAQAAAKSGD